MEAIYLQPSINVTNEGTRKEEGEKKGVTRRVMNQPKAAAPLTSRPTHNITLFC